MIDTLIQSCTWLAGGCTMVHFLWIGTLIGLFALAGRRILRRASFSANYIFTICCLLILTATPIVLFVRVLEQIRNPVPASAELGIAVEQDDEDGWLIADAVPLGAGVESGIAPPRPRPGHHGTRNAIGCAVSGLSPILPWVWITVTPMLLAVVLLGLVGAKRLKRRVRLLHHGPIAEAGETLAGELGLKRIRIGVSEEVSSPTVIGIIEPLIVLPEPAIHHWQADHVKMVLLHELWHVRRHDNLVNLIQRLIESIMFFQPVVWWVSQWVRVEREHCCDSAVLLRTQQRLAYAEILASLAGRKSGRWGPLAAAMGEHNLVTRIQRILDRDKRPIGPATFVMGWALLTIGVVSVVTAGYAQPALVAVPSPRPSIAQTQAGETTVPGPHVGDVPARPGEAHGGAVAGNGILDIPTSASLTTGEGVTLRLVDETGQPVQGAHVGVKVKWREIHRLSSENHEAALLPTTDRDGVFSIRSRALLKPAGPNGCDPDIPCYFFHEQRQLAGTINLTEQDWGRGFSIVMRPVCRLIFALDSEEVRNGGGSVTWAKGFVRLPGNRLSYLLRDTRDISEAFEYLLPPGEYELVAFAGNASNRETLPVVRCFTVPVGVPGMDLGLIQLPQAPRSASYAGANTTEP